MIELDMQVIDFKYFYSEIYCGTILDWQSAPICPMVRQYAGDFGCTSGF